jgi:hypothetical protein
MITAGGAAATLSDGTAADNRVKALPLYDADGELFDVMEHVRQIRKPRRCVRGSAARRAPRF